MPRSIVLGILNVGLSFLFGLLSYNFLIWSIPHPFSMNEYFQALMFPFTIYIFAGFLMNMVLAFRLLFTKFKIKTYDWVALSIFGLIGFAIMFAGFFFAAHSIFHILVLIPLLTYFAFFYKKSRKVTLLVTGILLCALISSFIVNFKENYCEIVASEADPTGSKMIVATTEDAKLLKEFNIGTGAFVGVKFRENFACKRDFNFPKAFFDRVLKLP